MTVIAVLICCCVPNFIKRVHALGLQTPITAECSMRRSTAVAMAIASYGGHVGNVMGCDHPSFIQSGPLIGQL